MSSIAITAEPQLLGEILLRRGQIRKYQLEFLLKLQQTLKKFFRPCTIGELLIKHRAVTALALTEALAVQESMPTESVTEILKEMEVQPSQVTSVIASAPKSRPTRPLSWIKS